jgi:hypothetical protein
MNKVVGEVVDKRDDGLPNKETLKALQNVEQGKNLVKVKDLEELFKRLGI